ncbi:putative inorganic phosphate cotransporter, partial [Cydia strobilella]|uniref:putative inorganic phosphate cotransporter n=1 Tax=Cydia strobilella TaxID=1100964 RepID=UPI003007DA16
MANTKKNQLYGKVPVNDVISENEETHVPSYGYGIRHVQAVILFICMLVGYMARTHLGVTIVAMTNEKSSFNMTVLEANETELNTTDALDFNITDAGHEIHVSNSSNEGSILGNVYRVNRKVLSFNTTFQTYDWSKPIHELILGAFFVGYAIAMFPTGMICQRFGGKLPLQISLLINGIVTLATPSVAVWGGWKAVYCCRVIQGLSQAGLYPSAHCLLAKWVPVSEKATISSFVYTGTLLGTVIAFQIAGLLANTSAGWPSTFWITGALCIAACLMLTVFGAASPDLHKTISEDEKNFILGKIDDGVKKKTAKAPWKRIFTSLPVWSAFITQSSSGICLVFLFTQLPSYMHYILGFNVKDSGLLSSLPYIASSFANIGFGVFSDFCINRGYLSTKNARKVCNSFAHWGPAVCLVSVSFIHNSGLAVLMLIMAVALTAGIHSGWMVNFIDLSPNYSGSLMATGNTFSTIGITFLPVLVSNVVIDAYDPHQWRIVLFVIATIISICNAVFVLFMSADKQLWDQSDDEENAEAEKAIEITLMEK